MSDEKPIDAKATTTQLASVNLDHVDVNDPAFVVLVEKAKAGNDADHQLTVMEAVKKYKTATFWAMILSTALIMEGFDLTIVRCFFLYAQYMGSVYCKS